MPERFEEYCPKLVAGQTTFDASRLLFTSSSGAQVSFPTEAKVILEHCDGTHNVRAIATLMLQERKKLSFRLLMETLEELRAAHLLTNAAEWPDAGPQNQEGILRPWWQRSWLQIPSPRAADRNARHMPSSPCSFFWWYSRALTACNVFCPSGCLKISYGLRNLILKGSCF